MVFSWWPGIEKYLDSKRDDFENALHKEEGSKRCIHIVKHGLVVVTLTMILLIHIHQSEKMWLGFIQILIICSKLFKKLKVLLCSSAQRNIVSNNVQFYYMKWNANAWPPNYFLFFSFQWINENFTVQRILQHRNIITTKTTMPSMQHFLLPILNFHLLTGVLMMMYATC